ncbi:MAG: hypothetical protein ACR2OB_10695 [Solirubrobacteraceae bacterium]
MPVAVWHDAAGVPAAYCYRRNGTCHVDLPGVGSYRFDEGAERIEAVASPFTPDERLVEAHRRAVVPLALQALGHEVLHASAVSMPCGVVAFCGPSGVGKSTLACAMGLRGHTVRADDVVALEFGGRSASVVPLPFVPRLSEAALARLGAAVKPPLNQEIAGQPLAAIVALKRLADPGARPEVSRLAPLDAFKVVFSHGLCFNQHDRARMAIMLEHYLGLAAVVPAYRAAIATDFDLLPAVLDGIESALR